MATPADWLFDVPDAADTGPDDHPAGGVGCGNFTYTAAGEFRAWRMHPGEPVADVDVPLHRFSAWVRTGSTSRWTHLRGAPVRRRRLFPLTWDAYDSDLLPPVTLGSLAFSPFAPGYALECSLPVHVWVWRLANRSTEPVEAALMFSWQCAWPYPEAGATFDMQHDNRCIAGSLGRPAESDRTGIAMPDLYSQNVLIQGMEAWTDAADLECLTAHFADDGEAPVRHAPSEAGGLAAWVKLDLAPGEVRDLPFVACWHLPVYAAGPARGSLRRYTEFLGKRRPDNAIVWLAEQALEDFGSETPGWRYWLDHVHDWHCSLGGEMRAVVDGAAALLRTDTVWTDEGRFEFFARDPESLSAVVGAGIGRDWLERGTRS